MKGKTDELTQAFLNLIYNAIEACQVKENAWVKLNYEIMTDRIIFKISDNGPGIPKEIQEKIFEPFFTTKTEGNGIGLSFVQKVIMENGGKVYLDKNATYTTFIVECPIVAEVQHASFVA